MPRLGGHQRALSPVPGIERQIDRTLKKRRHGSMPAARSGATRRALELIRDGLIADFGPFADVSKRHQGLEITEIKNRLILPGFIDGHIHFPQVRVLGAYGAQLLDWLTTWIFPEELKYNDRDYARTAAKLFFDALLAGGTTTCMTFTTSHATSTEEFFDEATRRNMRQSASWSRPPQCLAPHCGHIPPPFLHNSRRGNAHTRGSATKNVALISTVQSP